jgi:hypothetical protein
MQCWNNMDESFLHTFVVESRSGTAWLQARRLYSLCLFAAALIVVLAPGR